MCGAVARARRKWWAGKEGREEENCQQIWGEEVLVAGREAGGRLDDWHSLEAFSARPFPSLTGNLLDFFPCCPFAQVSLSSRPEMAGGISSGG